MPNKIYIKGRKGLSRKVLEQYPEVTGFTVHTKDVGEKTPIVDPPVRATSVPISSATGSPVVNPPAEKRISRWFKKGKEFKIVFPLTAIFIVLIIVAVAIISIVLVEKNNMEKEIIALNYKANTLEAEKATLAETNSFLNGEVTSLNDEVTSLNDEVSRLEEYNNWLMSQVNSSPALLEFLLVRASSMQDALRLAYPAMLKGSLEASFYNIVSEADLPLLLEYVFKTELLEGSGFPISFVSGMKSSFPEISCGIVDPTAGKSADAYPIVPFHRNGAIKVAHVLPTGEYVVVEQDSTATMHLGLY